MDKAVEFGSLFDLIKNFDESYRDLGHKLLKVSYKIFYYLLGTFCLFALQQHPKREI